MAEFRLGRIRFVWKDEWAPSTTYYVDDVVRYGGKVYICQVGHTSDTVDFYEDLNIVPSNWNLMSDGQSWRGDWDVDTFYSDGDIVLYGGITYICNTPHTSNSDSALSLEADQAKWDVFAESFIWQGDWAINTQYKKNDVVAYGGITYICRETHQSALSDTSGIDGLAEDSGKWQVINPGLKYRETWSSGTTKYRVNDVVKYGAGLWICTVNHVPDTLFETDVTANRWSQFVEGFEFENDWSDSTVYQPGDIVRYGGNQYVAKTNHSNSNPLTVSSDWDLFSEGLRFESDWSIETSYKISSIVRINGYSYLATTDSPSIGTFASATDSATNRITVTSSAGMVAGMAIRFTGTSFGDINPGATYFVKQVVSSTEIIVSNDAELVSTKTVTTDTGGMTVFAAAHPSNTNYFQRLVSGIAWQGEWIDDTEYEVGDAIRYGSNAYICIKKHRSEQDDGSTIAAEGGGAANSRPDQDITGTYWNVLAIGSETAVLTTRGDLVYYGGSGPTRLPVGTEGQVLRVSTEEIPEWVSLGAVENVYYVAPNGIDQLAPISGLTQDKPWKTIRYACEQVEKGTKNPNARTLLELNRVFIQREVTEWIQYQIANNISPFTSAFVYEDFKCERDVGFTVDALIYDITHGGNVKTRGVANALVGGITEDSPGAYPNIAVEKEESIAAYTYMLSVITKVLDQEAPAVNYQTTNGDNSTAIVDQYFDATITAEATALPRIQTLTTIITNALEDEDTSRIPARNVDEVVIMVKTGRYREVLPIIVPESTCILGDELRSTNAGPAGSVVDRSDSFYSVNSLSHFESVISDVIAGTEVTATTGNTEVQSREWPYGESAEQTAATQLVRTMQHNIDYRIGTTHMASSEDPIGYNFSYLQGYGNARSLVLANKEFLKAEVIAFIAENYPTLKYSRTKCKQDVGYIVDALVYDLTYGGYTQSLNAGLAYYEGYASQRIIDSSEVTATVAAYAFLKTRLQSVIGNVILPTPLQTAVTQVGGTAGSAASITFTNGAIDIISSIVNGGTDNWPSVTITTIATNVITTSSSHGLQVGDIIIPRSTANGFVKNTRYWVITVPGANQMTVSTSFGGSTASLTNGTSLSITANKIDNPAATNGVSTTTALITATETLSAAQETIIENVIDDLNQVAYHTDFVVRSSNLTNDDFEVYVGKNDIAHTYVSGGILTKSNDTTINLTNFVYNESTGVATVTTASDHGLEAGDIVDITNITVSCTSSGETREFVYPSATSTTGNRTKVLYIQNKCIRDLRLILNAVGFDVMFDSNFQSIKAGYSYLRSSASEVFTLNQKQITRDALTNAKTEAKANVGANATAQARIESLMTTIDDIIYSGSTEGDNCATGLRNRDYAVLQLERNREFIVAEVSAWMNYNYVNFDNYYNSETCERDVGYIVDAVSYDLITGSNFASSVAGAAYYRAVTSAENVVNNQLLQTTAAFKKARELTMAYADASLYDEIATAYANILTILEGGLTAVPTYSFPDNGTTAGDDSTTAGTFQTNRATIISDVSTYLSTNYTAQWTALGAEGQATCQRDIGYIIDAATFDVLYGGNYQSVIAGDSYYSYGTLQIGAGDEKTATLAALTQLKSELVADAEASSQTAVGNNMDDIIDIVTNGAGTVTTTYPSETGETATIQSTFTAIQGGKSTIQSAVTTYITDTFSSYTYDVALCERDVNTYIDAIKYDLKYPGNYKSLYAARYYANAVVGSLEEDMYYVRNATGIRNQTLEGLTGDLLPENQYGTSRVSAGAYVSLDPGWGPDDYRAWVITRSCYVQGVTTFGTAAVGQKIDGSLHNGGNDSIVSNDFTQVISDGIGAWVSNNGRAELVSVFTYYAHIGYLSESGGRIRGTNGNCSYGDFGAVAEGFDAEEIPNTAIVENAEGFNAVISSTITDGDDILSFEFDHAGNEYTEVSYIITGGGVNADIEADEFRDDAVFQVRLLDLGDDSSGQFGGDSYLTAANTAQGGTTSSITLAAVDQQVSSAYVGMKVFIDGGAGQGQYGIVSSYNAGTKLANVVRESDGQAGWDHVLPGRTIVSPNASSTYVMEPAISFTSPGFQADSVELASSGVWEDVIYGETAATYTGLTPNSYIGTGTGATFDVTRNGSKYIVTMTSGGVDYARLETFKILGTSLGGTTPTNDITFTVTSINSVTGEILEYDWEGFGLNGKYVAVKSGTTNAGAYSTDGETWTAMTLPTSSDWTGVAAGLIDDGSSDLKVSRFVAISTGGTSAAWSADGVNWFATSLPASAAWTSVTYGSGRFVAVASDSTTVAISLDGEVWDVTGTLNSTGFVDVAYGMGLFVAVKPGNTDAVEYSDDGGVTWTQDDLPANSTWTSVTWGRGAFVAVASDSNNGAISVDGATWTAMTVGSPDSNDPAGYQRVRYGQGLFMATATLNGQTGYQFVMKSENGLYWTDESIPTAGVIQNDGYKAIAFGNPQREGYWIVIQNDSSDHAVKIRTGATARARAFVAQEKIFSIRLTEPGSGYNSVPTMTVTDPNNTFELPFEVRIGKGALATPSFINRGQEYTSANAEIDADNSNGFADFYQPGNIIFVKRLSQRPVPGSNVVFGHLPDRTFKLVNIFTFLGQNDGSYTAFFQVSPELTIAEAPESGTSVTTRIRFSQVRLTGHDFLDIGTGSFAETNYPGTPTQEPIPANETQEGNGGRVFYTSTDQDGNFRVGGLFTIEQSTGVATLNADAFNIAGLQELSLGEVTLGGGSASIDEFSTDPFFTADSDSVVPTQRAVKAFIASQIGGGGASLNVNSVTAGSVFINTNQIRTVDGSVINMRGKFNFKGPVTGYPLAWNYFLV